MATNSIRRIPVWSSLLRLAHWGIALSTLFLIASGFLIEIAPAVADAASDWHQIIGVIFSFALTLRLWLLFFDSGTGHWRALLPIDSDVAAMKEMLLYYLAMGKREQPRWFAHNPLWKPVYLLILPLFAGVSLSGHFLASTPILFGFYLPSLHATFANVIVIFTLFHLVAVFYHDLKGTGSDVSAMINGHRIFVVEPVDIEPGKSNVQQVSIDDLFKSKNFSEKE